MKSSVYSWVLAIAITAIVGAIEFGTAGWLAQRADSMVMHAHSS
ncbi:MAG TPA: hypothetical protein VK454_01425 [Myxococcaceae bacterium]|nr:hypothetical protein [Myxococcaceae bacterium]